VATSAYNKLKIVKQNQMFIIEYTIIPLKDKKILPGISNSKYQNPGNVVAKP